MTDYDVSWWFLCQWPRWRRRRTSPRPPPPPPRRGSSRAAPAPRPSRQQHPRAAAVRGRAPSRRREDPQVSQSICPFRVVGETAWYRLEGGSACLYTPGHYAQGKTVGARAGLRPLTLSAWLWRCTGGGGGGFDALRAEVHGQPSSEPRKKENRREEEEEEGAADAKPSIGGRQPGE